MEYLLPFSKETEIAILSCMLIEQDALIYVAEKVVEEDFYLPKHRVVFSSMMELFENDVDLDLVTLIENLEKKGALLGIGGQEYIIDLSKAVISASNIESYVEILKEKSTLRKLTDIGKGLSKEAGMEQNESQVVLNKVEQEIFNISQNKKSSALEHIKESLSDTLTQIIESDANKGKLLGLSTGFKELDRLTLGMQKEQLIIVAGRPGMGKTSFALNIASHVAMKEKVNVAIFSLEMGKEQLTKRIICSQAMVDLKKASEGTLNENDFEKVHDAVKELMGAPIYIDDTAGVNVMSMRSKCRRLKMKSGLGLVVIDYLQLMEAGGKSENRQVEVSKITRALKVMARELGVPILLLSQLSRGPEARVDKKPNISDLRESGSIEQDADNVILIFRKKFYFEDADDTTELILAKQRSGPTGVVKVSWRGELTRFLCLDGKRKENN